MTSPSSAPLRLGLVGVGGIGGSHIAAIAKLAASGDAVLAAAADPSFATGRLAPAQLASLGGAARHDHYAAMLEREHDRLDAVVVAAPIALHFEIAAAALARGLRVYLEKPPVPLVQDLDRLLALDRGRVAVGFQMISTDALRRAKEWIVGGALGALREIRIAGGWPRTERYYGRAPWAGRMTLRGEPIFDGAAANGFAHLVHNATFLAGETADGFAAPVEVAGELYAARPMEAHDIASLRGRFASGATFTLTVAHAVERTTPWRIEIVGSKGTASILESGSGAADEAARRLVLGGDFEAAYRDLADWLLGRRPAPAVPLAGTRGYLAAVNGALLSSGGVRPLAPAAVRPYRTADEHGETEGRDVPGLSAALERTLSEGLLLSEQGLPWARPGTPVDLRGLKEIDFAALCGAAPAVA